MRVRLQTQETRAAEWQLSCNSPPQEGSLSAKALLQALLVNPPALTLDLALLQPVPLTLSLQLQELQVHLLAEAAGYQVEGSATTTHGELQALGVVHITSFQVRDRRCPVHMWLLALC